MKDILCMLLVVIFSGILVYYTEYEKVEKSEPVSNVYCKHYKRLLAGKIFVEGVWFAEVVRCSTGDLKELLDSDKKSSGYLVTRYINPSFYSNISVGLSAVGGEGNIKYRISDFYYSVKWRAYLHFYRK